MRNLKKVLAFVTMITMLLSVAVSAGTLYPDVDNNASYAEAVETLNALNIMIGDEKGNFNPDASITRAEAAALVARVKGLEGAASNAGGTIFADVPADHWAAGYVNLAQQSGIINGYGNGNFGPSDPVTYEQIIKMIVAAMGYATKAESNGGYPSGYMIIAAQTEVTKGVSVKAGEGAPRSAVARLVYNALDKEMRVETGHAYGMPVYSEDTGKTLLNSCLKIDKYEGIVTSSYLTEGNTESDKVTFDIATKDAEGKAIGTKAFPEGKTDAATLVGYTVVLYVAEDEVTEEETLLSVSKKSGRNEEITYSADQFEKWDDVEDLYLFNVEGKDDPVEIEVEIAYALKNGGNMKASDAVAALKALAKGEVTFVNTDADEAYETVMFMAPDANAVVGSVDAKNARILNENGGKIVDLDEEGKVAALFKADGTVAEIADVKEGNIVTIYYGASKNLITVYISDAKVEGKVQETKMKDGKKLYKIAGNWYEALDMAEMTDTADGTFFLNVDGAIAAKKATSSTGSYAYFLKGGVTTGGVSNGTVEVMYFTTEGVCETATLAEDVTVVTVAAGKVTETLVEDVLNNDLSKTAFAPLFSITAKAYADEAPKAYERLIQLEKNTAGEISRIYFAGAADDKADTFSNDGVAAKDKKYNATTNKAGNVEFSDETIIISVPAAGTDKVEEIKLTKASALFQDDKELKGDVYAFDYVEGVASVAVACGVEADILENSAALIVSSTSTVKNEKNQTVTKVYGLQNGQDVELLCASGVTVAAGDVVLYSLDADGAIKKVEKLMDSSKLGTAFAEAKDDVQVAFGFVKKNTGVKLTLAKEVKENADTLTFADGALAEYKITGDANIYKVDTTKTEWSFAKADLYDIEANMYDAGSKDAYWVYVRVYEDVVVDVVAFRTENK